MSDRPEFRTDLYRGTASFYDRYRLRYPAALIDDLCRRATVDGAGRLLDVACGPGTVTFALSDRFADVWAVDQEPETVEFAARSAAERGVAQRAVDYAAAPRTSIPTRSSISSRSGPRSIGSTDAASPTSPCSGCEPVGTSRCCGATPPSTVPRHGKQAFAAIVVDWMAHGRNRGPASRRSRGAPDASFRTPRCSADAGFDVVGRYEFTELHDWTVPDLVGLVYSTSLLPRSVARRPRPTSSRPISRERLRAVEPSGVFREHATSRTTSRYRPPG